MNEEYLTRKEVASYLKIGLNSADKIIKNSKIVSYLPKAE